MKIYLVKRSYFTFRGKQSWELDLLGRSVLETMRLRLRAEVAEEGALLEGDKIVLYPVYPFLTGEELENFAAGREGSFSFAGGYVDRGGTPHKTAVRLGDGLFSLGEYPAALARAAKESALYHAERGALVEDGAEVDFDSILQRGAIVRSGARVKGVSVLGENSEIGCGCEVCDSEVGAGTTVRSSYLSGVRVGANCTVGPFAYLRAGSHVEDGCRIGDFVEIKNSRLGKGCKSAHLAYIGDAELGENVNVGCGVVFANYNGKTKSKTRVGNGCFLGSNCNLVAPVTLGDCVFLAAGTTLTRDLKEDDFCVGRCRETVKEGRAKKYL